eukprot:15439198-Alexandrium_andersonii.AAC.1
MECVAKPDNAAFPEDGSHTVGVGLGQGIVSVNATCGPAPRARFAGRHRLRVPCTSCRTVA